MDDDGEFLLTLLHEDLAVVCPEELESRLLPRLVHASQQLSCGAHQVLIYVDLVAGVAISQILARRSLH